MGFPSWVGASAGSSPRVRGKPGHASRAGQRDGLIPARAGKTRRSRRIDGPRPGSSPRVRGKPRRSCCSMDNRGLIPARAGKTGSFVAVSITPKAHPRACGENPRRTVTLSAIRGSSPRVRGKHKDRKTGKPTIGLIPARAGKTGRHWPLVVLFQAHPRACGENG